MKIFPQSLRLLAVLTVLTGVIYPLAVWAVGHAFFRSTAEGSLLHRQSTIVGSSLIAQKNSDPRYFSPRPSAGDYATVASGASNLAWTSTKLRGIVATSTQQFRNQNQLLASTALPLDVTTTSGSGLDPDLSPAAVHLQIPRIAQARGLDAEKISMLVERSIETSVFGPARINVLKLNLALDELE